MIVSLFESCLDLVFPRLCLLCEQLCEGESRYFCGVHWGAVSFVSGQRCRRCGCPLAVRGITGRCASCRGRSLHFARASSALVYEKVVKEMIAAWKFEKKREAVYPLAKTLFQRLSGETWASELDLVSFVPLHRKKRRERGFNQAQDLAVELSRLLEKPMKSTLIRVRETVAQGSVNTVSRKANVSGAFAQRTRSKVMGQRVLLVDDVMTSGATVSECSRVLKQAGAKRVYVATVARAGV